jgi:hypothetical protein
MLYFALRAFGFLITKHKHKNNNLLFSLTPFVFYSFSPLPYSFIHLPAVFAPYFSPFPSLFLLHFTACVRSSHCPRVTFSLSSSSFPFLFFLSSSPLLQPAIIFLSHSLSSLLLICVFVPLPFYSPSPCTFSRRVVFLFSPSSSKFSSVSPVSHPIYTSPRLSVFSCILFSPFFLYLSPLWPTLLTSFVFPFLLLSNRHLYTSSHLFFFL